MKLLAIIQPTNKGLTKSFSAYSPDIPGCIANGATEEKALEALKSIITHQIQSLKRLGMDPPKHYSKVKVLEIDALERQQEGEYFASLSRLQ
ncbi:MAG: type II toxin-antitoxin system HicB family antitoxin [Methylomicrobium sp.]